MALILARQVLDTRSIIILPIVWFVSQPLIRYATVALHTGPLSNDDLYLPFHVASRLAYAIYLNHFVILLVAGPLTRNLFGSDAAGFVACSLVTVILCLALAFVTFALIKLPGLRLRARLLGAHDGANAKAEHQTL